MLACSHVSSSTCRQAAGKALEKAWHKFMRMQTLSFQMQTTTSGRVEIHARRYCGTTSKPFRKQRQTVGTSRATTLRLLGALRGPDAPTTVFWFVMFVSSRRTATALGRSAVNMHIRIGTRGSLNSVAIRNLIAKRFASRAVIASRRSGLGTEESDKARCVGIRAGSAIELSAICQGS